MAYKITKPDGTTLITLADNVVDQSSTSLTLVGKNYSGYGEFLNNNLVRLLTNSASSTSKPPRSPLTGQVWYDTAVKRLKVYDGGFRTVNGVPFATSIPVSVLTGDLWYDTTNGQLKLYNGLESVTIGPAYPSSSGENGWVVPQSDATVNDLDTDSPQNVLVLKSYDESLAIASGTDFKVSAATATEYMPTRYGATAKVVKGLTITGDLNVYGQMSNYTLSTAFKIDNIYSNGMLDRNNPNFVAIATNQNLVIADILTQMYPPNAKTTGSYQYPGLPVGTLARVALYNNSSAISVPDRVQYRLFRTVGTVGSTTWQPYNGIFTILNLIDP